MANDTTRPENSEDLRNLWTVVARSLNGRLDDMWSLVHSDSPGLASFMRMGPGQGNMSAHFSPKSDEGPGQASVRQYLGVSEMNILRKFLETNPHVDAPIDANRLALIGADDPSFTPGPYHVEGNWDGMGMLCSIADVISANGPDLFNRIGPWYVDSLETIWNVMIAAGRWHRENEFRRAEELRGRAETGDTEAQFQLAVAHLSSESAVQDEAEGLKWLKKSAEMGHANAQYLLGNCIIRGHVTEQDHGDAASWWLKAAKQGHAEACLAYGSHMREQENSDFSEYGTWYQQAADKGHPVAEYHLGLMLLDTEKPGANRELAISYLHRSGNAGYMEALEFLASGYRYGRNMQADPSAALEWMLKASNAGSRLYLEELGRAYELGVGTEKNYAEAFKWYERLMNDRGKNGALRLGNMFFHGRGVGRDVRTAIRCWQHARSLFGLNEPICHAYAVEIRNGHLIARKYSDSLHPAPEGDAMIVDTGSNASLTIEAINASIPGVAPHIRETLGDDVKKILGNADLLGGSGLVIDLSEGQSGTLWIVEPGSAPAARTLLPMKVEISGVGMQALMDTGAQYSYCRKILDPRAATETVRDFSVYTGRLEHFDVQLQPLTVRLGESIRSVRFGNLPAHLSEKAFTMMRADAVVGHELFSNAIFSWNANTGECWVESGA